MNDNFKIILEAMIDQSSLSNVQKQVAKERIKVNADISLENFAKSKAEIEKQTKALGNNIKSILGDSVSDKQANQWAKQYYDSMVSGAKQFTKELDANQKKLESFNRTKSNSLNKIDAFIKENSALTNTTKNKILELRSAIESTDDSKALRNLNAELTNVQRSAKAAGETGRNFGDEMKNNFRKFSQWVGASTIFFGMTRAIKGVISDVIDLDTEMTSLKKVTEATDAQFENFLVQATNNAKLLGASITEIVKSASEFSRLGYNLPDATELSRVATLYKNVGDGISIEDASSSIISTMKAYNIQASDAESIIDKFNKVGNEFSISSAGIGDALKRSASALKEANNDLSQSIALQVGANNVIQDEDVVGTMWKSVALRIRGAKTELEEAGLETEGMVESTSKLRDMVKGMTGFDILMPDEKTFKSTYDIVVGIGKEYDKLSDIDQAALLNALGGLRQSNALAAALII